MTALSLYRQVLDKSFECLPAAVRRFHQLSGHQAFSGWVETRRPESVLARFLAMCLGTPQQATSGVIRFELTATPEQETWTRHFPTQTMRSRFRRREAWVEEKLGASTLRFQLHATESGLVMELQSLRFFGVPCPRWLLPTVVAKEHGNEDRLHFEVSAALPLVGVVAAYKGHLVVGLEESQ